MSKYYPLKEISQMEYFHEEILTIADLEKFAKKHGFSNDQVWFVTKSDCSGYPEREIHGKREATEEEKKAHYKDWEEQEELAKKEANKRAYEQKKAREDFERKEWVRLNKKYGKKQ